MEIAVLFAEFDHWILLFAYLHQGKQYRFHCLRRPYYRVFENYKFCKGEIFIIMVQYATHIN